MKEHGDVSDHLDIAMMKMLIGKMEMVEVYSPPRVAEMVRKMGIKAGWGPDMLSSFFSSPTAVVVFLLIDVCLFKMSSTTAVVVLSRGSIGSAEGGSCSS